MSHLSPHELDRLEQMAFWIREVFSERGHQIGTALSMDPSFREGERARSGLARAMMQAAVTVATSQIYELNLLTGEGGVREVHSFDYPYERRYRVLRAKKDEDGFRILSSSDAILAIDHESLHLEEPWVLAYTLTDDNQMGDLFVAQVRGRRDGQPGELVLGPQYPLLGAPPKGGGFQPTDEDLPMPDDKDEDEAGASDVG